MANPEPKTHIALITLGKKLGYSVDEQGDIPGLCNGVTLRCLEAYLLGEQNTFIARINHIASTKNLDQLIHAAQDKVKKHQELTPKDLDALEVLAFYDSLILYQAPGQKRELFHASLTQQDISETSKIAGSEKIREEGGLTTLFSESRIYKNHEIERYLTRLNLIFNASCSKNSPAVTMLLSNLEHAIGLIYQPQTTSWVIMDISQWPPLESNSIHAISNTLIKGFDIQASRPLNTTIITTPKQHNKHLFLKKQLDSINKHYPLRKKEANRTTVNGINLAHVATITHDTALLETLAYCGANLDLISNTGETPLSIAAAKGYSDCVDILGDHGMDLNKKYFDEYTALSIAAERGHAHIVTTLGKYHVELEPTLNNGPTPLQIATIRGHTDVVTELAKRGVNLSKPQLDGQTPLFSAAWAGHADLVRYLLSQHVKIQPTSLPIALLRNCAEQQSETIVQRTNDVINKYLANNPEDKENIAIMPQQIANIMGHHAINMMILSKLHAEQIPDETNVQVSPKNPRA